jgi:aminoglycoside phosphotransferase (APT) family kinase protein
VSETLATREPPFDAALVEREIIETLRSAWPPRPPDRRVLLHCDIWLGNLLWSDRAIVGVIDWETAHVGDPLADLAITRLACAWSFGRDAVHALTERYATRAPVDAAVLAVWDLAAALRPVDHLATWAGGWADYGRPDMTVDRMRAAHRWFAAAALDAVQGRV